MGWFSKTPASAPAPAASAEKSELERAAYVTLDTAEKRESELAGQVAAVGSQLAAATASKTWLTYGLYFLGAIVIILLGIFLYDYIAARQGWQTIIIPSHSLATPPPPSGGGSGPATPQKATAPVQGANPPLISKFMNVVTGSDSSGDLAPSLHDASTSMSIAAKNAPLSNQTQGAYGIQWWMFVKDWNYGYGKDKSVIVRADPTNTSVMNPSISLHPTDNTLKVSISLFPSNESGSKATPAPAGSSGTSTDDVFVCEVPNIPLQSWFSVSVTVFSRNVDIYIDGKLVKSCLLPGVPKPAVGDIQITPNGGFSGNTCNIYHYPRMLTPADAMTFFSAGTPCQNQVSNGASSLTGYAVKFGVYDTLGKQVQEYTF